jgi:hypothetical protein
MSTIEDWTVVYRWGRYAFSDCSGYEPGWETLKAFPTGEDAMDDARKTHEYNRTHPNPFQILSSVSLIHGGNETRVCLSELRCSAGTTS